MRIGCDLDGVTFDFQGHWIRLYKQWFDRLVYEEHANSWNGLVTGTHFKDEPEFFDWFDSAKGWESMPSLPGAFGALYELQKEHEIIFLTSRHGEDAKNQTVKMINDGPFWHLPLFMELGSHKEDIGCDVYIDDSPAVIKSLTKAGKRLIKFNHPWNDKVATRWEADDWGDVQYLIERHVEPVVAGSSK